MPSLHIPARVGGRLLCRCNHASELFQDSLYGQYKQQADAASSVRFVTRMLKQATVDRLMSVTTMTKLEALASARLGLSLAAEWLHKIHCTNEKIGTALGHMTPLNDALRAVCDQKQLKWTRCVPFSFTAVNLSF